MERRLAEFQLIKSLGQGAMGKVYLAEHVFMKKQFALKILPEDLATDRHFVQRFEQEISVLSQLDHPSIARIHQASFADGCYFIVTDLAVGSDGESVNLQQYLNARKEPLAEEEILQLLTQVASALDYAHARKRNDGSSLAHLSLRPSNILISGKLAQTRAVLTDFGLHRLVGSGRVLNYLMSSLSREMLEDAPVQRDSTDQIHHDLQVAEYHRQSFHRAFQFMAPEQKRSQPIQDTACDVYAFGVLAYYLLVGDFPEGVFELPSLVREDLDCNWDRMIMSCLSGRAQKRPRILSQLIEAVRSSHGDNVEESEPEELVESAPAPIPSVKSVVAESIALLKPTPSRLIVGGAAQAYQRAVEGIQPSTSTHSFSSSPSPTGTHLSSSQLNATQSTSGSLASGHSGSGHATSGQATPAQNLTGQLISESPTTSHSSSPASSSVGSSTSGHSASGGSWGGSSHSNRVMAHPAMALDAASAAASFPAGPSALVLSHSKSVAQASFSGSVPPQFSGNRFSNASNLSSPSLAPLSTSDLSHLSEGSSSSSSAAATSSNAANLFFGSTPGAPGSAVSSGASASGTNASNAGYGSGSSSMYVSPGSSSMNPANTSPMGSASSDVIVRNNPALNTTSYVYVGSPSRTQPIDTGSELEPIVTSMKSLQGGRYLRGSNDGSRDEMPRHAIVVADFAIDVHPVTNDQFARFLRTVNSEKDEANNDMIRLKESRIKRVGGKLLIEPGYHRHPVVGVTWYGALAYCKWVGKRLPTEAEWEIAARGGVEDAIYSTGDNIEKSQANFFNNDTTAVMSYPPNSYDLYDIAGNVYEWCHDWYAYNTYELTASEPMMPEGPLQGVYRVLRGGCWKSLKEDLRCAHRHRNNPGAVNRTYGFRCASDNAIVQPVSADVARSRSTDPGHPVHFRIEES